MVAFSDPLGIQNVFLELETCFERVKEKVIAYCSDGGGDSSSDLRACTRASFATFRSLPPPPLPFPKK